MATVLLVEDDPAARQGLELALRRLGYGVRAAETGEAALRDFPDAAADVVVLDVMLPGLDGFEVCRRLRRGSDVPVIMLTARGDDLDIVGGLEAGADDYVVKPVEPRVLDARIRAVIRRTARAGSPAETYGELVIDRGSLIVRRAGRDISLTPTELRLLLVLSGSPRQVFSREQLLDLVWEHDYLGDSRLVDACVQRLRAKIEADTSAAALHPDGSRVRVPVRAGVTERGGCPVRRRLIVAFIVVALLAALASSVVPHLDRGFSSSRLAGRRADRRDQPGCRTWCHSVPGSRHPTRCLYRPGLLRGGSLVCCWRSSPLWPFAASRPVLLPVRRLARAAQRMSGGDLSVRIQPRGRDELAQLVTSFNGMASALEDKVGELERMEARARQFAGDVSHELRTPLTAMTAVVGILARAPGTDRGRRDGRAAGPAGGAAPQPAGRRPHRDLPLRCRHRAAGHR